MAEDPARIYVYSRRETAAHSFLSISCDSEVVAEVKQGLFFAVNVSPGRHVVLVDGGLPLFVEVVSGQESFVRLDWNYGISRPPIAILSQVNPLDAQREMRYLGYIPVKRVRSKTVSETDPRRALGPQLRTR